MQPIKIGFLSLYSGVYPQLNQQLVEGFVLPFVHDVPGPKLFEFIPEYVQQGGVKAVSDAVKKLVHFHQVDVISGLMSYQVAPELIPLIESRNTTAFFFDLGEYLPSEKILSPKVFYNSFQLWQTEYALGAWAHQEFGDKGMVLMPLYEAGYQMHAAFRQGTVSAGSSCIDYHMLPYVEGPTQVSHHVDHLLETLRITPPSFLHVLFSGTEASEFLAKFFSSGLQHRIPLIVSPLMANEEWLQPITHLSGSFFTGSSWNPASTELAASKFVQAFRNHVGKVPGLFELLGYEMGLVFKELLPQLHQRDWPAVHQLLQNEILSGPRGPVNFWPQSGYVPPEIAIEKITLDKRGKNTVVIDARKGMLYNSPAFKEIHLETKTGWQNPYLCV